MDITQTALSTVTAFDFFRMAAPEFAGIADDVVSMWIELTRPMVSRKRFKPVFNQALALLTAHRMKMLSAADAGEEGDGTGDGILDGIGTFSKVSSFSEGDVSINLASMLNTSQYKGADAELALTPYGLQYMTLRDMYIIPITSAGEAPLGWAGDRVGRRRSR